MSAHYSKFLLNTYDWTPYFEHQLPPGYPLLRVLQKSRAFRRLPPNLRQLATLSRQWAESHDGVPDGIQQWYDSAGNELDPATGRNLTNAEIDAEWDTFHPDPSLASFTVTDIPIPPGGFADPRTWEEPTVAPEPSQTVELTPSLRVTLFSDGDSPDPKKVLEDIVDRGKAAAMEVYGLEEVPSFEDGEDSSAAEARFAKRAQAVLNSPYVAGLPDAKQAFMREALDSSDTIYEDLGGEAWDIFDRAEASLALAAMAN